MFVSKFGASLIYKVMLGRIRSMCSVEVFNTNVWAFLVVPSRVAMSLLIVILDETVARIQQCWSM
jgi:hypothetical protein